MTRLVAILIGSLLAGSGATAETAGQASKPRAAQASAPPTWHEPATGMAFVPLPKGCYRMGTADPLPPKTDLRWQHLGYTGHLASDEMPKHEVCLDAFWLGVHQVTAAEWEKVTGARPPAGRGNQPAGGIDWDAAQRFAEQLTAASDGQSRFRLPTEAEWEYACRAGHNEDSKPDARKPVTNAWYNSWSGTRGHPALATADVGSLPANAWGLHDMLGNVWEWVSDHYAADAYARHTLYNPQISQGSTQRVIRGASHRSEHYQMRCATRSHHEHRTSAPQIGLRLVRQPKEAR